MLVDFCRIPLLYSVVTVSGSVTWFVFPGSATLA